MAIHGAPPTQKPNHPYSITSFKLFIPRLNEWARQKENRPIYNKFVKIVTEKLNYSSFLEEWDHAVSLGVAHYIVLHNPEFAQSIGPDSAAGGYMGSRSIGSASYSYDKDATMNDNPAYKFWNQTGYGRALVNLMHSRGFIGMFITS